MLQRLYILLCLVFLVACNDGDIITIELDFDQELKRCENDTESYLLYDTREDPNESLILIIAKNDTNELFFNEPTTVGTPTELTINSTTTRFIFRSFNRAIVGDELCDAVPAGDLVIREDYEANSGTVNITATIVDDDNDDIPSEDEYGPGGLSNPQDSDTDGIPDYLDEDDDNDNVKTKNELDTINADADDNPLTNPLDTDGDTIPNYLDNDDDGDGISTRLEDISLTKNPRDSDNYVVNTEGINVYRYLYNHTDAMEAFADSGFIYNYYTRSVATSFIIENAGLEIINADYIDFGTYENSFTIDNVPE